MSRGATARSGVVRSLTDLPGIKVLQRSGKSDINFSIVVVSDAWDMALKSLVDVDMTIFIVLDVVNHGSEVVQGWSVEADVDCGSLAYIVDVRDMPCVTLVNVDDSLVPVIDLVDSSAQVLELLDWNDDRHYNFKIIIFLARTIICHI